MVKTPFRKTDRVQPDRSRVAPRWNRAVLAAAALLSALSASPLWAQSPVQYRHSATTPPGAIGSWALRQGGPLAGYYQPVEVKGPAGSTIAIAADGAFLDLEPTPVRYGLLIAPVYRLRVANIPNHEGQEVFPTIEMIDRTYPPCNQALNFPVPIDITEEDLTLALSGKFVTRVIYIEDPKNAVPVAETRDSGRWFDAGPNTNPVELADVLGRPIAILRIGGRIPDDPSRPDPTFLGSGAPLMKYPQRAPQKVMGLAPAGQPADQPPAPKPDENAEKTARRRVFPLPKLR
jgi:hypothetical protein